MVILRERGDMAKQMDRWDMAKQMELGYMLIVRER